jgi:hypothetical protein
MSAAPDSDPLWDVDRVATYLNVPKRTLYTVGWFASLDDHLLDDRLN